MRAISPRPASCCVSAPLVLATACKPNLGSPPSLIEATRILAVRGHAGRSRRRRGRDVRRARRQSHGPHSEPDGDLGSLSRSEATRERERRRELLRRQPRRRAHAVADVQGAHARRRLQGVRAAASRRHGGQAAAAPAGSGRHGRLLPAGPGDARRRRRRRARLRARAPQVSPRERARRHHGDVQHDDTSRTRTRPSRASRSIRRARPRRCSS